MKIRRAIHAHPEPGFKEDRTAALVRERLDAWGIEHQGGIVEDFAWVEKLDAAKVVEWLVK